MKSKTIALIVVLLAAVVGLSILSVQWWGGKSEELELPEIQIASGSQTVAEIARSNEIPLIVVLEALKVDSIDAAHTDVAALNLSTDDDASKIKKSLITYYEHQSKNWKKIFLKFLLWFLMLPIPVVLITRSKMIPGRRKLVYLISVITFGVILGSDPSPMGTVKDAVFLLTAHKTVFGPRLVALGIFLLTVVLSTKLICSWGCQFGALQDLIFRLGRNKRDRKSVMKQFKPPFWLSNSVRILFFLAAVAAGLIWALDIVGLVDPFRIYKPLVLGTLGISFLVIVLAASLLVYRPWCHFACPFGLVSWFFEKLAIFRIKVDYSNCDACQACNNACPSTVMDAILKQDRVVPDCFGCGVCVESCPTGAVSVTSSRKNTGDYSDALTALEVKREDLKKRQAN